MGLLAEWSRPVLAEALEVTESMGLVSLGRREILVDPVLQGPRVPLEWHRIQVQQVLSVLLQLFLAQRVRQAV